MLSSKKTSLGILVVEENLSPDEKPVTIRVRPLQKISKLIEEFIILKVSEFLDSSDLINFIFIVKRNCSSDKAEPSASKKRNKYKKVTQTSTSSIVIDDLEKEKQMISLREKKLELEEKELKLERGKLEILKLKQELGFIE